MRVPSHSGVSTGLDAHKLPGSATTIERKDNQTGNNFTEGDNQMDLNQQHVRGWVLLGVVVLVMGLG